MTRFSRTIIDEAKTGTGGIAGIPRTPARSVQSIQPTHNNLFNRPPAQQLNYRAWFNNRFGTRPAARPYSGHYERSQAGLSNSPGSRPVGNLPNQFANRAPSQADLRQWAQRNPGERVQNKDFNLFNFSNPYRSRAPIRPEGQSLARSPSPPNSRAYSQQFGGGNGASASNSGGENDRIPTLSKYRERLQAFSDNAYPREISPPEIPFTGGQSPVVYRVWIRDYDHGNKRYLPERELNPFPPFHGRILGVRILNDDCVLSDYDGGRNWSIYGFSVSNVLAATNGAWKPPIISRVQRGDGLPDTGGDPPPTRPAITTTPNQNFSPQLLSEFGEIPSPARAFIGLNIDNIPNDTVGKEIKNEILSPYPSPADYFERDLNSLHSQLSQSREREKQQLELLREIEEQLNQTEDKANLLEAAEALRSDLQRIGDRNAVRSLAINAQARLALEEANAGQTLPVGSNPRATQSTSPRAPSSANPVNSLSSSSSSSSSLSLPTNPIIPGLDPNSIIPIRDFNPDLSPETQQQTRTQTTTQERQRSGVDLTPNVNTPRDCKNSDEPLAKCIGAIENKLDKIDGKIGENNPNNPPAETLTITLKSERAEDLKEGIAEKDLFEKQFSGKEFALMARAFTETGKLLDHVRQDLALIKAQLSLPDSWQLRKVNNQIPQLVVSFKEKKDDKFGTSTWAITIPRVSPTLQKQTAISHWKNFSYQRGDRFGILQLLDGSKISVNATSEAEVARVVSHALKLVESNFIPPNKNPNQGRRKDSIKKIRVIAVTVQFYPRGQYGADGEPIAPQWIGSLK